MSDSADRALANEEAEDGPSREIASNTTNTNYKRLCWVCFGTDQDDDQQQNPNVVWIYPCQCKGTVKWVHEECLQRWIDEKQKRTNSPRVSCSQCKTYYILTFPPVNRLIELIERYDKLLFGSSPLFAASVVIGSIYWCCGSYGYFSIIQVMGYDDGRRIIDEADPLLLVIGLPVIPIALILAKSIKWEDFILKLWRRSANNLPKPLSYIIDKPPAQPRANCDQLLLDPGFNEPIGCTRMICGALLLPTVSALIGKIFFSKMSGSTWRKSLVGGCAFLLIKGLMKIYFRKSQYIRYSQRTINNYNPPAARAAALGEGSSSSFSQQQEAAASTSDEPSGSLVESELDADNRISRDSRINQDDSDEESQPPRAVFSMTIRI